MWLNPPQDLYLQIKRLAALLAVVDMALLAGFQFKCWVNTSPRYYSWNFEVTTTESDRVQHLPVIPEMHYFSFYGVNCEGPSVTELGIKPM